MNALTAIHIATGKHSKDTALHCEEYSHQSLSALLREHRVGPKDGPYFIPAKFAASIRLAKHIVTHSAVVLDLDAKANVTETIIRDRLPGLTYFAYTTHSHMQGDEECWRVVIPYSQPVPPSLHAKIATRALLPFPGADPCTTKEMQFYYLPACPPGRLKFAKSFYVEGEPLHPARYLDQLGSTALSAANDVEPPSQWTDGKGHEDWLAELLDGEDLHSNVTKLVMRWVARGWTDAEIMAYLTGVRAQLESARGAERVNELFNGELQRSIAGARKKKAKNDLPELPLDASKGPFSFKSFSLNGSSKAMRAQMLDDVFVIGQLAILGQKTAIYAKPNSGKTLLTIWLLIEAIKRNAIEAENVFYINADDNFRGLTEKLELAEKYGFQMIAPGYNDFRAADFLAYLNQLIKDDTARGIVVILDTLKKFTDIMDKRVASDFGNVCREFSSKGGTVIMLAHTNKNRDNDGKVVFSGTSDIVDDVDCAYTLDVTEETPFSRTVLFENFKDRGNVVKKVAYCYDAESKSYTALLESVEELTEEKAAHAKQQQQIGSKLDANAEAIEAIIECVQAGVTLKTEVIQTATDNSGLSRAKISKALRDHTGASYHKGHRWIQVKGEKAARHLEILSSNELTADAYKAARGE